MIVALSAVPLVLLVFFFSLSCPTIPSSRPTHMRLLVASFRFLLVGTTARGTPVAGAELPEGRGPLVTAPLPFPSCPDLPHPRLPLRALQHTILVGQSHFGKQWRTRTHARPPIARCVGHLHSTREATAKQIRRDMKNHRLEKNMQPMTSIAWSRHAVVGTHHQKRAPGGVVTRPFPRGACPIGYFSHHAMNTRRGIPHMRVSRCCRE